MFIILAHYPLSILCMLGTQFFFWMQTGPINTLLTNSVPAIIRARAVSINVLILHTLGDALSPIVIGLISGTTGSLRYGISIIPIATSLAAIVVIVGWLVIDEALSLKKCAVYDDALINDTHNSTKNQNINN
eukprot:TRINITY_DN3445_c0_g2_i1.p1 TRINITY_DN3445_c0_g2~~TRINITY_DN3445_c0_g2_i1.p1  ORF type:complete len:132 (-),score=36.83 TRINITY_DN3445_c0_g2_i1:39-434(-)